MRWRTHLAAMMLGALTVLALPAAPANAHATLVGSAPTADVVVDALPGEVVVTFSEPVRPVADKVRVITPDGGRLDTGKATARGADLVIPVRGDGSKGTYLVSYRVISADNHPISGGFAFSYGQVSATPTDDAGAGVQTDPLVKNAMSAARWIGFLGLILLVGPALILLTLWPARLPTTGPARLAVVGGGLVAVSTLLELYLQIPYTSGNGLLGGTLDGAAESLGTAYGAAHLVRLAAVAAAVLLLRPVAGLRAGKVDRALLILVAVVGAATWPLSGHPSASPVPALTVVADAAHLAAMAVWVGGLVVLFGFLLRRASHRELAAIMPVWSGWALLAVTVLVLAGTAQALVEIGTLSALTGTLYGRLVITKVGLFAVIIVAAAYARDITNRDFPAAADDEKEAASVRGRLRIGVLVEIGVVVLILGVTSVLVQTTPARSVEAASAQPGRPVEVKVSSNLFQVVVDVSPAKTGINTVHLYARKPDGSAPLQVVEWKATVALPAKEVEPITVPMVALSPDHASGQVAFPSAGTWDMRITVRVDDINQATVTARVPVR
ncbi:copper resistance CopC/CopD family protein [Dactylosporangium siamense]|uniref:Copper resistance protein C n=1 Tax=Dactylosporangium siamense TaxID=685454 RepID=A0A919U9T7_9ACTN|nr:copper resistance protein CopC [Dactylosporangium siamense]GIG47262.1 copper resistance protein C [Dactylosporangium siamense]